MKIALVQKNYIVGDLTGNSKKILQGAQEAHKKGADLVLTSELSLLGYPSKDLLFRKSFIQKSWQVAEELAKATEKLPPLLIGLAEQNTIKQGKPLFNSALLLEGGKIKQRFHKSLLPTYDVFDEDRYFEPSQNPQCFFLKNQKIGLTICEDVWNDRDFWREQRYHNDPVEKLVQMGARCILNMSGSPFSAGKQKLREKMLSNMARKYAVSVVYINQVGGNDDLIFDGRSSCFDGHGNLKARAKDFEEDLLIWDLESQEEVFHCPDLCEEEEIWKALVLGTRDYTQKCGFKKTLLGLSGGIDSALTAVIAAQAVGSENVLGVLMPSPYSSQGSLDDSYQLAKNLGISTFTIPIGGIMQTFDEALREPFQKYPPDVTEENIQARIRGNILMSISNKYGSLLLTTGNKSELSVGYCTLYGDMSGGLAVISDVHKTMVYRLSRWLNREKEIIPQSSITKAPSAELKPNQTDQDSLPPYDILDAILKLHVEHHQSLREIVDQGYSEEIVRKVLHLVKIAEFKRKQAAPGIKVTDRAFGTGWRMPIASRTGE